jgi:mono/diheme cytochrome c family protein
MRRTKDLEDSVKNQGKKLMTFRAFSIGFSAALLALACGSDSNSGDEDNDNEAPIANDEPAPSRPQGETCDDNPLLAGCTTPDVDVNDQPISQPNNPAPVDQDDPAELARAQAQNILASNCGQCHGPALNETQASAGMNYINDMERLAEEGKLIPGNSQGSRIVQRMRDGSMPPQTSGRPLVPAAEIDTVAQFIDNPLFWPDYDIGEGADCSDQLFTFDDLYQVVARDLASLDDDDQVTARYIALSNRFTAGVCADTSLDRDRQGLFKLLNALSIETTVEVPVPVDADETIYRIDLTDYGWDRAISAVVNGVQVDAVDGWEFIAAINPYAIEFFGDDADDAKEDAATNFPVMFADTMLDAASIGNAYYALIDVDVNDTLDNFILNDLGIDVAQNLIDEDQVRAGTTRSRISRQDRVVQRDEIEVRQGVLWQSFDFEDDQNESIFEDPFGFAEGGTEAIFTLPNGMFGFVIADENSAIVEDSDILLDTQQNNFRAVTMISCSSCHAQGLIPVQDEVREIAIANARVSGLNNDEVEQLEAVYPAASEFARIVEDDTNLFFRGALNRANVDLQGGDPISTVFFRFDQDMRLEDAAGDLGLTPEDLLQDLNLLNPALQVLDNGVLDRDDFTGFYADSLCKLQVFGENAPDPDFCAAVDANGGLVP